MSCQLGLEGVSSLKIVLTGLQECFKGVSNIVISCSILPDSLGNSQIYDLMNFCLVQPYFLCLGLDTGLTFHQLQRYKFFNYCIIKGIKKQYIQAKIGKNPCLL